MENQRLTPEQSKEISKIVKKYLVKGLLSGVKYGLIMMALTLGVAAANVFYVKSESFPFIITLINMIFIMHFILEESKKRTELFRADLKRVIQPEEKK
jgi:hypothetical protein